MEQTGEEMQHNGKRLSLEKYFHLKESKNFSLLRFHAKVSRRTVLGVEDVDHDLSHNIQIANTHVVLEICMSTVNKEGQ